MIRTMFNQALKRSFTRGSRDVFTVNDIKDNNWLLPDKDGKVRLEENTRKS